MINIFPRTPVLLLIGLFCAIMLLFKQMQPPLISPSDSTQPDAYMESINAITLDQEGHPKMQLKAPKLFYYAKKDATYLSDPELKLYSKSPDPWLINSERAIAYNGYETVDFWDNVHVRRTATPTEPATLIETTHLTIHPEKQTAETNDLITLTQAHTYIKAVGLFANMDTGDIHLLSQTWGEYIPDV